MHPFEELLNRVLAKDPHLQSQLVKFGGKSLQINVDPPGIMVTALLEKGRIRLLSTEAELLDIQITASITGNVGQLLPLILEKRDNRPLSNPALAITGDASFIQELHASLSSLDIDWEDYLAPLLGNLITNELSHISNDIRNWSKQASVNMRRNVNEYLTEEERIFPKKEQLDDFSEELDYLKIRIDRINAKASILDQKLIKLRNS
jgi:ubiquinone biosynthesis protein UbiJ